MTVGEGGKWEGGKKGTGRKIPPSRLKTNGSRGREKKNSRNGSILAKIPTHHDPAPTRITNLEHTIEGEDVRFDFEGDGEMFSKQQRSLFSVR